MNAIFLYMKLTNLDTPFKIYYLLKYDYNNLVLFYLAWKTASFKTVSEGLGFFFLLKTGGLISSIFKSYKTLFTIKVDVILTNKKSFSAGNKHCFWKLWGEGGGGDQSEISWQAREK